MYENGEITKEQFNSFQMIRSLDDEGWKEIKEDYKNGKISKEQFNAMKQIREMPEDSEDWATLKNGLKGVFYGTANGLWEGVQWYLGGKLSGWTMKGHRVATSAVRVGIDTAFNSLDTPFRAGIDTLSSDKTFQQAWKEQGGWHSVLVDTGIGLAGSAGGEVFDGLKLSKASKVLNSDEIFDDLDELTSLDMNAETQIFGKTSKKSVSSQMQIKIDRAKDLYLEFNSNNKYLSPRKIKKAFEKVHLLDDDQMNNLLKQCGWSDTLIPNIGAFNLNGEVYLKAWNDSRTIIHEVNHSLGDVRFEMEGLRNPYNYHRGVNEAFTEKIAIDISGTPTEELIGGIAYPENTFALNAIEEALEKRGYKDIIRESYFGKNSSYFAEKVEEIGGAGFYDKLAHSMNDVAGFNSNIELYSPEWNGAYNALWDLVDEFCRKAGVI